MDGQTKHINQEVEQYLWLFINHWQDDWSEWVPMAEFSYNNKVYAPADYPPSFLNYRHHS